MERNELIAKIKKEISEAKNGADVRKLIEKYKDELSDEDLKQFSNGCDDEPCENNCCLAKNEKLNCIY